MERTLTQSPRFPLLFGIVALDGILILVQKPPGNLSPQKYFCRKEYSDFPIQVECHSSYCLLFLPGRAPGMTHDSFEYSVSILHEALSHGSFPEGSCIAKDDICQCSNSLLTPWTSSIAKNDSAKDASNFIRIRCELISVTK